MTPEQIIQELNAKLQEAERRALESQAKLDKLQPADFTDKDEALLKTIAEAGGAGVRRHQVEASAGSAVRGRFHLDRLLKKNFVKATGGGDEEMRYKLDDPGLNYLVSKDLI